jgi:hypothetical protein
MNRLSFAAAALFFLASKADAQFEPNVFDLGSGANTYHVGVTESLNDDNWVNSFGTLLPNVGTQFLESDNGNSNQNFLSIGLSKHLGGTIQNHPYSVSFNIAKNLNLQPVELADFSTLRIGGLSGSVLWTSTPTPVIDAHWYKWSGTYTPSAADLGNPFIFTAVFDLDAQHSIALDGWIAVPEPATLLLALVAISRCMSTRRSRALITPGRSTQLACTRFRRNDKQHGVEVVGRKLRKLMSWINSKEVD